MNYEIDNIFVIGDSHEVCQDYSYSGMIRDNIPYVIICDGCSSSQDTDIGARILAHGIKGIIESTDISVFLCEEKSLGASALFQHIKTNLQWRIMNVVREFGLNFWSVDSTIRLVLLSNNKLFLFHFGDGYTILKNHTSGIIEGKYYADFTFDNKSFPYYFIYGTPLYLHQKQYTSLFRKETIKTESGKYSIEDYVKDNNNFYNVIDLNTLERNSKYSISVISDGVDSFYDNEGKVSSEDAINSFLAFKNFKGNFVNRRIRMYLLQSAKLNRKHYDDISIASIVFETGE